MKRLHHFILCIVLILSALPPFLLTVPNAGAVDPVHQYKFHNHEDLTYDLHQWLDLYPHIMELSSIGTSYLPVGNPHDLWNIHLTNFQENRNRDLPEIYLDGGHHGNEYCGSEITILMLQYLLENYGSDPDATFILDNSHVYITPMINPDGIDLNIRFNANHVDLNRNYPYEWVESDSVWGGHGDHPGSEPEVAANIAFMEKHQFDLYLTGHTGIVMLIYPWGYIAEPSPDDSYYKKVEEEVEAQWDIPTGQSAVILYPAAGTAKDHGYAVNHAPSWTFEVDDQQFVPVSGKWWPELNVKGVKVKDESGDGFTAQFTINNTGYMDVVNGTATLEIGRKSFSTIFSVGQFNETVLNITVPGDWDGEYDITLTLDTTRMMVNDSQPLSFEYQDSIEVDGGGALGFPGGGELVLVVVCVMLVSRARNGPGSRETRKRSENYK